MYWTLHFFESSYIIGVYVLVYHFILSKRKDIKKRNTIKFSQMVFKSDSTSSHTNSIQSAF